MDTKSKDVSMQLAEDARQENWEAVSFTAEVFKGTFRWDLLYPFPAQAPEDKKIGDEYIEKIRPVIEKFIDPWQIDEDGEYGDGVQIWPRILRDAELGKVQRRYHAPFKGSFNDDPPVRRDLLDRANYLTSTSVIATRGCSNRCGFCYLSTSGLQMPYRARSVELLRDEIAHSVAGPQEVEDELRHLRAVLSSQG